MSSTVFTVPYIVILWLYLGCTVDEAFSDTHGARWQLIIGDNQDHYAATEHGGLWGNFLLIAPLVGFLQCTYPFEISIRSAGLLLLALSLSVGLLYAFKAMGMKDHIVHDERISRSGWLLAPFTALAIWIIGLCMLGWTRSPVTATHALVIAWVLTAYFLLGVVKFNRLRWRWRMNDTVQVGLLVGGVWLWYFRYF